MLFLEKPFLTFWAARFIKYFTWHSWKGFCLLWGHFWSHLAQNFRDNHLHFISVAGDFMSIWVPLPLRFLFRALSTSPRSLGQLFFWSVCFLAALRPVDFPDQGLTPNCSYDLCCSCNNAGSLTNGPGRGSNLQLSAAEMWPILLHHSRNSRIVFFQFVSMFFIVNLQSCVRFKYAAEWFSYTYIYTCVLFQILFHYWLLQDTEYSSLCYTVGPCCLPILYSCVNL